MMLRKYKNWEEVSEDVWIRSDGMYVGPDEYGFEIRLGANDFWVHSLAFAKTAFETMDYTDKTIPLRLEVSS